MFINHLKSKSQILEPPIVAAAAFTLVRSVELRIPEIAVSQIFPTMALYSGVNVCLAKVLNIHEKHKFAQVALPFFSGLASATLMAVLRVQTGGFFGSYVFHSSLVTLAQLIKVVAKGVLKLDSEPKEESMSSRVFNYIVLGIATIIPSGLTAVALGRIFAFEEWMILGSLGFFFGLAQVCVTTLLGAPQESRGLHASLPFINSILPFAAFAVTDAVTDNYPGRFVPMGLISLGTSLLGTIASRYFANKSRESVQSQVASNLGSDTRTANRVNYRRPGFSAPLPHHQ